MQSEARDVFVGEVNEAFQPPSVPAPEEHSAHPLDETVSRGMLAANLAVAATVLLVVGGAMIWGRKANPEEDAGTRRALADADARKQAAAARKRAEVETLKAQRAQRRAAEEQIRRQRDSNRRLRDEKRPPLD